MIWWKNYGSLYFFHSLTFSPPFHFSSCNFLYNLAQHYYFIQYEIFSLKGFIEGHPFSLALERHLHFFPLVWTSGKSRVAQVTRLSWKWKRKGRKPTNIFTVQCTLFQSRFVGCVAVESGLSKWDQDYGFGGEVGALTVFLLNIVCTSSPMWSREAAHVFLC